MGARDYYFIHAAIDALFIMAENEIICCKNTWIDATKRLPVKKRH